MKKLNLIDSNLTRLWAQGLIAGLLKKGIRDFYVSPGMRNAPLIAAINHFKSQDSSIFIDSGFDERSQSFRALGRIRGSERPAVVVCTSGSALAHYAPAVIEAHKSGLPLIVLSSDRPVELSLADANQTTEQNHFFGRNVRYSTTLEAPTSALPPEVLLSITAELVDKSLHPHRGPVHLNVPFREPLDGSDDLTQWPSAKARAAYVQRLTTIINTDGYTTQYNAQAPSQFTMELSLNSPVLIVVGELYTKAQKAAVIALLRECQNLAFILDVASGIKYEFSLNEGALPSPDHPEVYKALSTSAPQTLIHIGGRTTSKHYYRLLREWDKTRLIMFDSGQLLHDPAHRRAVKIQGPLETNLPLLIKALKESESSSEKSSFENFVKQKSDLIDNAPLAYPSLSKTIIEHAPEGLNLFIGNSTVIRSFDSYASTHYTKKLPCFVQRGASGIEGLLSEAIGLCDEGLGPVALILGDISLLHDLNALVTLKQSNHPLIVIIANNGGGGIFHLLPAGVDPLVERELFTPQSVHYAKLAEALELRSVRVENVTQLRTEISQALTLINGQGPVIIEALIDDTLNSEIYRELKTIKL